MQTTRVRWERVLSLVNSSMQQARQDLSTELADWRALLLSLRTQGRWQVAWRAARPLLAYAVGYVIAQYASAKMAYAMNPRIAGPSPLFIHGGVAISALLLTPARRWWLYLLLTFPAILIDAW